jgi:hypothetical protein
VKPQENVTTPAKIPDHEPQQVAATKSGGNNLSLWIGLLLGLLGLIVVWRIVRRFSSGSASGSGTGFRQWSGGTGGTTLAAPSVRLGPDGFWINGNLPAGTTVYWRWRTADQFDEGQTPFEPGPEGLFIYTGTQPQAADAWLENAAPPVDPSWPAERDAAYNRGTTTGLMQSQFDRDRELRQLREREEEERRRHRGTGNKWRSSTPGPARDYPSAY